MRSMTGFGRGTAGEGDHSLVVTAQSWNHRHVEILIRLPDELRELEPEVRGLARARIARGRCEIHVRRRPGALGAETAFLDVDAVERFGEQVKPLVKAGHVDGRITAGDLARSPFLRRREEEGGEIDASLSAALLAASQEALEALDADRRREGRALAAALGAASAELASIVSALEARRKYWSEQLRERVRARLQEILPSGTAPVPEERLAQEIVLLADRTDVREELERLASHLNAYDEVVGGEGPHGKRLDFWAQEIARELNTLGAKSRDAETTRRVVDAKVVNEQLREQVQNVE